jgi:hypothetical protein
MGAASSIETPAPSPAKAKQIKVVSNVAPSGYVFVPKDGAFVVTMANDKRQTVVPKLGQRDNSNVSAISTNSEQDEVAELGMERKESSNHVDVPLMAQMSEDAIDTIEMNTSTKIYWKDLDASTKRSSWREMEIASLVGTEYYTH